MKPSSRTALISDQLQDTYGRTFSYLRLSITESCNFRCLYCLPNGCGRSETAPLSVPEIAHLARGFAALGISKIRVTGGEPSVRKDLVEVIRTLSATPGIRTVGLTTNGGTLARDLPALREAGLGALNLSIDSLEPALFARITGQNRLDETLDALRGALVTSFPLIKVNVVLLKGLNDGELPLWERWVREYPLSVRFIELMPTRDNREFFQAHHLPVTSIETELREKGWNAMTPETASGPATVYSHRGYSGTFGFIAAYSKSFCESCNRLRVTASGQLRLCLFGEQDTSIRHLLQRTEQTPELVERIGSLLARKPAAHQLCEGRYGDARNLASIGG